MSNLSDIDNILPLNSRQIFDANENFVGALSLATNSLLAAILLTEKNKILRAYSQVLLQNCACDVYFTLVSVLVKPKLEYYDGDVVVIAGGILENLPLIWHYVGFGCYLMGLLLSVFVIPVVFYFRYCLLVRKINLTHRKLLKMLALLVAWSAILGTMVVEAMLAHAEDREESCLLIFTHPLWTNAGTTVNKCILASGKHPLMMMYYVFVGASNIFAYVTMIYCTLAVFAALRQARSSMHKRTAILHGQMNTLLVVQLILPTLCASIPLAIAIVTVMLRLRLPGLGLLVLLTFSWIPLINPLITILLVSNYRRKCAKIVSAPIRRLLNTSKVFPGLSQATTLSTHASMTGSTAQAIA